MRRRVMIVLALMLPLAASSLAGAAPGAAKSATAGSAASASASSSASTPSGAAAAGASASAGADAGASGSASSPVVPPSPAVSVDMSARGSDPAVNGGTYSVRLRDLEQRVDELKDQIRRSHTRLALLSDSILGGSNAGSRADVVFANEMSGAFVLTRALFVIDGQVQYNRQDDSGVLADQKQIPIYSGSMPAGDHTVQIALTFQGNGFGVFSYLRGYKFEVKSSHSFSSVEGKALTVTATAYEKGGVTTPLEQRPTIEWHEKSQGIGPAAPGGPIGTGGAAAVGGGQK